MLNMLRFLVSTIFALGSAFASPASAIVGQYLEFVTKYHVDADSINATALKTRLEAMLMQRCGKDASCPTTAVYDDLKALTKTLPDASSSFLSPLDLKQLIASAQSYSLGVEMRGGIVYRVAADSSAAKLGVKRGDRIVLATRDGAMINPGAAFSDAKPVTVRLERDGKQLELSLTPALGLQAGLLIPEANLLSASTAYLRIPSFRVPSTATRVHSLLSSLQSRNPKELVIDLRFNTGGYLEEALLTLSAFLADGAVMQLQSRSATSTYSLRAGGVETIVGETVKRSSVSFAVKWSTRTVILVNPSTSSASEIFALSMKRGGSSVVGETSAGRARYAALPLKLSDGSELRLAVTRNAYPNGEPMPPSVAPTELVKDDPSALAKGADPVLEAALKLLEK